MKKIFAFALLVLLASCTSQVEELETSTGETVETVEEVQTDEILATSNIISESFIAENFD